MHPPNNKTTQAIATALAYLFHDWNEHITYGEAVVDVHALERFLQGNEDIGFDWAAWIAGYARTRHMLIKRVAELRTKDPKKVLSIAEQLLDTFADPDRLRQIPEGDEISDLLHTAMKEGGYIYGNGVLRSTQDQVVDTPDSDVLEKLYETVIGPRPEKKKRDPFEALANGHRHQASAAQDQDAQLWSNALGYFRTAVELVLSACAVRVASHKGEAFTRDQADRAHVVREKLKEWEVLSEQELKLLSDFHSFGSEHGSHAAGSDNARDPERVQLARQMAPIFIQFILSRVGQIVS
jgi:hypothetical protein